MEKAELSNITALGGTVQMKLLVAAGAAELPVNYPGCLRSKR